MTLPTSHKVYRKKGISANVDNLSQSVEPIPSYGKDDILVKVKSVALNQRDIMILTGMFPWPVKDEVVPCSDFSGEVVAIGNNVSKFEIGDRAIGNFLLTNQYGTPTCYDDSLGGFVDGGLREYVALPAVSANKIPKSAPLSWDEMSSLVCAGVTAWNGLYGIDGTESLKPGQTVLAIGTGGVSAIGLAIARAAGMTTIVTSSSDEKLRKFKYDVDYTVNYKTHPNWADEVLRFTDGVGADIVLENGGSGTISESVRALAVGGRVSIIGVIAPATQEDMPDITLMAISKAANIRGVHIGSTQLAEQLIKFTNKFGLKIPIDRVFKFDEAPEAFQYLQRARHIGKVCIRVAE
jgi:NADPH:quinone reductase-like Zn-dependent oxidoreductase